MTILFGGESGARKELVAQEIHRENGRKSGPVVHYFLQSRNNPSDQTNLQTVQGTNAQNDQQR
jgi:DNA-binding NtrC family response regulator